MRSCAWWGGTATIFQRMNRQGDMLRVATTVREAEGRRAIGTYIPATAADGSPNPVIAAVLQGRAYHGRAFVVDSWHLAAYAPLMADMGQVAGMLFSGSDLAQEIRRVRPEVKILMSGYAENLVFPNGIFEPGIDLIQKPFNARGLLSRVRGTLDR